MGGQRNFAPVAVGFESIGAKFSRGPKSRREVNCEYVGEISGSIGFAVTQYPVNPGQVALFPWLSTIASRFERYRFHKLKFLYRTEKSTATDGTVMFAVDYDASDAPPTSKTQLLQNEDKERKAPWQEFDMECTSQNLMHTDGLFIRPGMKPGGTDIKTYDVGNLLVATQGMSGTSAVGELWVDYDVELLTPVLESSTAPVALDVSQFSSASPQAFTSTVPTVVLLGTADVNGLGVVNNLGTMTLPAGNYLLIGSAEVAGTDVNNMTLRFLKNGAAIAPSQLTSVNSGAADTSSSLTVHCYVSSSGSDTIALQVTANVTGSPTVDGTVDILAI